MSINCALKPLITFSNVESGKIDYCLTRKRKLSPIEQPKTEIEAIANMAKAVVQQKTAGHYPAPIRAIELMQQSASLSRDEAIKKEAGVFYELSQSPEARALIGLLLVISMFLEKHEAIVKPFYPTNSQMLVLSVL